MDLPQGWQLRYSRTHNNRPYYYNEATGQTQWEPPTSSGKSSATAPAAAPASSGSGRKVHVYHLLVKHAKSRRPSSWRAEAITLSEAEALETAKALRTAIFADEDGVFEALKLRARERSDCSSAKRDGDLGFFGPGEMQSKRLSAPIEAQLFIH
jgi:NIMA-interacting peptidyl-prolyl cis-trans isomerase 1